MYKALYREFRPETFEEVLGQEHIVKILKNQLATQGVSHAYLFCGTRGTGKTTMARLLAKGVNCLNPHEDGGPCGECNNCRSIQQGNFLDVIEIDAASNNGVDSIRELRESVKYPPAVGGKKVYIIDEVHMLTTGAFNALLKTLEEPPEHVMFVLATTEPQKLLATILSRCMRLDFKRVTEKTLVKGMSEICGRKGINVDEDALRLIATNADGSVRDGLSILDQCLAAGDKHITRKEVVEYLGTTGEEVFIELTEIVRQGKVSDALLLVDKILDDGKDVRQFMKDWLGHYRNLMITKFLKSPEEVLGMSLENIERLRAQSDILDMQELNTAIIELSRTLSDARWSTQPRILLELCTVKLASGGTFGKAMPVAKQTRGASGVSRTAPTTTNPAAITAPEELTAPAVHAEPKAVPQVTEGPAEEDYDLEEIWFRMFEECESERSSFNLLRTSSSLVKISEDRFFVAVKGRFNARYVFECRDILEDFMSRFVGRPLRLECIARAESEEKDMPEPEEMKANLEAIIGTNVDLK